MTSVYVLFGIDSDFTPVDKNVTITGTDPEKAVKIFVVDDTEYEPDETFTVNLEYISSNVNALIEPPTATVTILGLWLAKANNALNIM